MAESSQKMFPLRISFRNTKKFVENLRFDKFCDKKINENFNLRQFSVRYY